MNSVESTKLRPINTRKGGFNVKANCEIKVEKQNVNVEMSKSLVSEIAEYAEERELTISAAIRLLIKDGLKNSNKKEC